MRSLLTVLWCAAAAVPLAAQRIPPHVASRVNYSDAVRVQFADGLPGNLREPRLDSAVLSFARGERLGRRGWVALRDPIPVADVRRIEIRQGSRAGAGATIGGLLGAGLAIAAIAAASSVGGGELSSGAAGAALVVWTGAGAGLGALIGSGIGRWETVYEAPR